MPFESKAQQRYFYANREKLERQGVDVDEWSRKTDFSRLPERKTKKKRCGATKSAAFEYPVSPRARRQAFEFFEPSSVGFTHKKVYDLHRLAMAGHPEARRLYYELKEKFPELVQFLPDLPAEKRGEWVSDRCRDGHVKKHAIEYGGRDSYLKAEEQFTPERLSRMRILNQKVTSKGVATAYFDPLTSDVIVKTRDGKTITLYKLNAPTARRALTGDDKAAPDGAVFSTGSTPVEPLTSEPVSKVAGGRAAQILDLSGLGILAIPPAYRMITGNDLGEKADDAIDLAGLGVLAMPQVPHLLFPREKIGERTSVDVTAIPEKPVGDAVQPRLLQNPYFPGDIERAKQFENGYEFVMGLGPRGITTYDFSKVLHAHAAWREGVLEGLRRIGRRDIADQIQSALVKSASFTDAARHSSGIRQYGDGLCCIAEPASEVVGSRALVRGVMVDLDGTILADSGYIDRTLRALQDARPYARIIVVTNRTTNYPSYPSEALIDDMRRVFAELQPLVDNVFFMLYPSALQKPSGHMLRRVMALELLDPDNCIYVGNALEDEAASLAANIPFVSIDRVWKTYETAG